MRFNVFSINSIYVLIAFVFCFPEGKKPFASLYIVGHEGLLTEYDLEPRPKAAPTDKISDDTPLELVVTGQCQWHLQR